MAGTDPRELLRRETRVAFGPVPHDVEGEPLGENRWHLEDDMFVLRANGAHWFHYRRGEGVTIDRGAGADESAEALILSGSVYSAVACINGLMPVHASAVCHEGEVYAFTGESGAGKSTLVTALAAQGLPLFCDDTLVLDLSDPDRVMCLPGHKRLKLTHEALGLTGADRQEQVARTIEKFYSRPAAVHEGGLLPLRQLVFLEDGEEPAIREITGSARLSRLDDDHYTAHHFAAARQFDQRGWFAHAGRLARQIGMSRFVRPRDTARFAEGVQLVRDWIEGR